MPDKPCHYDVLGLERDASDEEIKRVYRRLALFWHPDKNTPEQRDEATEVFRLVTEAYAVLGDPKQRKKYDRDGHPASAAGGSAGAPASPRKEPRSAAPTAPPPPPAPASAPAPEASQHVPQYAGGGWPDDGGWEGMSVNGGYSQGWMPPPPQQQQQYPFQQAPVPFMQHQQQFQQQQPDPFAQQQQGNAFMYGNQFGHQQQAYSFQQTHQHQHQHQAPPSSWGTPYEGFDTGGYGCPAPAPPMPPEPAVGPLSTELALPRDSPRAEPAAYPGGYSHHQAAAAAAAAAAASHGVVAHAGRGGFSRYGAPSYDDLPPVALAPPSTYPPSSESEDDSEPESEDSGRDVAVTRYGSAAPGRATATATAAAAAAAASPRRRMLRRAPKKSPQYPTETRYVPPAPERLDARYYPKETRLQPRQQDCEERPGLSRGGSGLVLQLHLGSRGRDREAAAPPTSAGPLVGRRSSRGGGSQGSMGGIVQQMDRMFSDVMGGGALGGGFSLGVAGEEGSRRSVSSSFSAGGGGSSGGGFGTASMMSSRTVVDAGSRTIFSRTERTVINADGTRETNVQEYNDNRGGSSRGSASGASRGRGSADSDDGDGNGDGKSQRSGGTSRRGSLRSFFGR